MERRKNGNTQKWKDAKMERGKERKKAHLKYRFFALKNVFLRVKMLKKYQKIAQKKPELEKPEMGVTLPGAPGASKAPKTGS